MTREITCPRCATTLRVAPEVKDRSLSCPRCLASVPNPYSEGITAAPPAPQAAGPERSRCPHCDEPVEPRWRRCPNCEAPLRQGAGRRRRPVDVEVKRDNAGAVAFTAVVALLVVVGLVLFFASGAADGISRDRDFYQLSSMVVLVLGAMNAGSLLLVWSVRPLEPGHAGVAAGIGLGILLVPLGVVVTFCVVCTAAWRGR